MSKIYPTKSEYEKALSVVKEYEQRQETLSRLAKDLSYHLNKFTSIKFKVNKKEGKVTFSGLLGDRIVIGESKCAVQDVFCETIGKLVAVKKAMGLDTKDVVEHVESKKFTGGKLFNTNGLTLNPPYSIEMNSDGMFLINGSTGTGVKW